MSAARIKIRPLKSISAEVVQKIGGGYISPARYNVRKDESAERTVITLELIPLDSPYVKNWEPSDYQEEERYQELVTEGNSLGAYDGDQLVGLALTEARWWNKTLWVWEFHIAKSHRRRGIGRQLMEAVVKKARQDGFRVVGLETQSTNFPAISFYRAAGFEIDALDLSLYTNTDTVDGEVAIFMKKKIT
jgi:ribosomal protein S18 acetylase RimI-like enzyme